MNLGCVHVKDFIQFINKGSDKSVKMDGTSRGQGFISLIRKVILKKGGGKLEEHY